MCKYTQNATGVEHKSSLKGMEASKGPSMGSILQNKAPTFVTDIWIFGLGFLEQYGWFIVFSVIILGFLWSKMKPYWKDLLDKWERQREIDNFDPVKAATQQERLEDARRRLQEQHNAKAAKFVEDRMLEEGNKRRERVEDWDRHQEGKGYRSKRFKSPDDSSEAGSSTKKPDKKPLRRSDYNPLSGDGGGFSYRPPRRGAGGGG